MAHDSAQVPPRAHPAGAGSLRAGRARGFTLTELLIAVAIVGILAAIALPSYERYKERIRVAQAVADIGGIAVAIKHFETENLTTPASLDEVGYGTKLDPWGRPYEYLDLKTMKGKGKVRKDKKLNPLNTDFDLYSTGKDGKSQTPLTAKDSRDDIVRARDGRFIGLATDFDP